jgi:hypothetical protein
MNTVNFSNHTGPLHSCELSAPFFLELHNRPSNVNHRLSLTGRFSFPPLLFTLYRIPFLDRRKGNGRTAHKAF